MESGDGESEELFSSESLDESCTSVLTYAEYTKQLKNNVPMNRTVVLQTSDSSSSDGEGEQDFLLSERKKRHQQDLAATSKKVTVRPTQHSCGGSNRKGQQTGSTPTRKHVFATSMHQKGTPQTTVGKVKHPIQQRNASLLRTTLTNRACQHAGAKAIPSTVPSEKISSPLCKQARCSRPCITATSTTLKTPCRPVAHAAAVLKHRKFDYGVDYQPEDFLTENESECSDVERDISSIQTPSVSNTSETECNQLLKKLINQLKKTERRIKAMEDKLGSSSSVIKKSQKKPVPLPVRVSTHEGYLCIFVCVWQCFNI